VALTARLYLCGFPKSGLHLAGLWAEAILTPEYSRVGNWFGTMGGGGWTCESVNVELIERALKSIRPGYYLKGHMGWSPALGQLFFKMGIGVAFLMRDLRDVVVSHAHHVCSTDDEKLKHPDKELYRARGSFEDVLIGCIEGVAQYPGIFERWEFYAGWLTEQWVLPLRFEQMVEHPRQWAMALARYAYTVAGETPPQNIRAVGREMAQAGRHTKKSPTFRKGAIGDWRAAFTPRVKDCFKAHDPGWLVKLGYTRNNEW